MNFTTGRHYLSIPGPSVTPERVLQAMNRSPPNIHYGEIVDVTDVVVADLKRLAMTKQNVAIYTGNGHGAWEAANANLFSRGDRVLIACSGQFGRFWEAATRQQGIDVETIDFGNSAPVNSERISDALKKDTNRKIRAVLVAHVDTASSALSDVASVRAAIDAVDHPALLVVDAVASLGCDELRMDDWGIDVLIGAGQKGLMVPPGIAFLWFSDRAKRMTDKADLVTPYWDWRPRSHGDFYLRYGGTPPTQHLLGLRESLKMILDEEGLEHVWSRHEALAASVWRAFEVWGFCSAIALNMADRSSRSRAVTTAYVPGGTGLREWLEAHAGVTLSLARGMTEQSDPRGPHYLRVAHMGHVNAHMILGVLATMEAGMQALRMPHGRGAVEAAAAIIAERKVSPATNAAQPS